MNNTNNRFWRNFTWKKFLLISFCLFTIPLAAHCVWNYFSKDPVSPLFTSSGLIRRAFAAVLIGFIVSGLLKKGFWASFPWKHFFIWAFIWLLLLYPLGYFFYQDDYKNFEDYTKDKLIYFCFQALFISFIFTSTGSYKKPSG